MTKQIMLIDDYVSTQTYLGAVLEHNSFAVLKAGSALTALKMLKKTTPDLIILDLTLPDIDGVDLCKQIRARRQTARTPIIILSGRHDTKSIKKARAAGANDYLTKPTFEQDLTATIHRLLTQIQTDTPPA